MANIKSIITTVSIMALILLNSAHAEQKSPRVRLNMNTDWAFYRGDIKGGERPELDAENWMPATLPHIMQLEKKHCGGNSIYDGVGWYRRYFKLPERYRNKRIAVSFEGVMNACELFVNGKKVTEQKEAMWVLLPIFPITFVGMGIICWLCECRQSMIRLHLPAVRRTDWISTTIVASTGM